MAVVAAFLCNCGSSSSTPGPNTITISNYTFSPSNLSVKPGTTITVANDDSVGHSLTSEAALNDYVAGNVNGVAFDTGVFNGSKTFTISSTAAAGTVIPYFCTIHLRMMGQGTITILAP